MLEIQSIEGDLQQYKELFERYRERIQAAAGPWRDYSIDRPDGTNAVLVDESGDMISLPTTDELIATVLRIRELDSRLMELKERLGALGFRR